MIARKKHNVLNYRETVKRLKISESIVIMKCTFSTLNILFLIIFNVSPLSLQGSATVTVYLSVNNQPVVNSLGTLTNQNNVETIEALTDISGIAVFTDVHVSIYKDNQNVLEVYSLYQNYPNPFNPETIITYAIPEPAKVKINIFNLKGQRVKKLVDKYLNSGQYSVVWDGTNDNGKKISSGVYIYQMIANKICISKKLVCLDGGNNYIQNKGTTNILQERIAKTTFSNSALFTLKFINTDLTNPKIKDYIHPETFTVTGDTFLTINAEPLDQIPPDTPNDLTAESFGGWIILSWCINTETDLNKYCIYGRNYIDGVPTKLEYDIRFIKNAEEITSGSRACYEFSRFGTSDGDSTRKTGIYHWNIGVTAIDISGNESEISNIVEGYNDATPPEVHYKITDNIGEEIAPNENSWYNNDSVLLKITAIDDYAGLNKIYYMVKINDNMWSPWDSSEFSPTNINLTEGINQVQFYGTDNAKTKSITQKITVQWDKTAPSWDDPNADYPSAGFNRILLHWDNAPTDNNSGFWRVNIYRNNNNESPTGSYNGDENASFLTDSTKSWTENSLIGSVIYNITDNSHGIITNNTSNTITAVLSGGTDNHWNISDTYIIAYYIGYAYKTTKTYIDDGVNVKDQIYYYFGIAEDYAGNLSSEQGLGSGSCIQ